MYNMLLTTAHALYKGREMTFETVRQLFLPPSCGALVLIAVKLPLILWLIPYIKKRDKKHASVEIHCQVRISETKDLEFSDYD